MNISPEFAELFGAFIGDGWISRGNAGMMLCITGNPADEKEYYFTRIQPLFKTALNCDVYPRAFSYWKTFGILVCKKKIIAEFIAAGAPVGKKSGFAKVPDFAKSNQELFITFVRGLFDTDGCINFQKSYDPKAGLWDKTHRHRPRIFFTMVSNTLAQDVYSGLRHQGFNVYLRRCKPSGKCKTDCFKVELYGKANARKFFDTIQPKSPKHIQKFEKWSKQGFYDLP